MKNLTISVLAFAASATLAAQTPQLKPDLLLYHPSTTLSSEVSTIKPLDPKAADIIRLPPGVTLSPLSIRRYIMNAYGLHRRSGSLGARDPSIFTSLAAASDWQSRARTPGMRSADAPALHAAPTPAGVCARQPRWHARANADSPSTTRR